MTKLEEIKYKAEHIARIRYRVYAGKYSLFTAPYDMGTLAEQIMSICDKAVSEFNSALNELCEECHYINELKGLRTNCENCKWHKYQ